jgi:acetoacetate decarboxylase
MRATKKFGLKGYSLPLTPKGRSSVIDAPPWYYGGEVIHIGFRTDPKKVAPLLPPPLEPGPEPGAGAVWFTDWVSVSEGRPDLAYLNPERSNYRECIVMLACRFDGKPGYFVPYIWVDNDFTLIRGFIQGFPKKLGRIYVTRLHELNPKLGGKKIGAKVKGICDVNAQRIVEGSMTFTRKSTPSEVPVVKFYLMRHFPSVEDPGKPAVHELTAGAVKNVKIADVWAGRGEVAFFPSPFEEVAGLGRVEAREAFYFSMGMSITGGEVLYKYR